jgi:hypothetical protein
VNNFRFLKGRVTFSTRKYGARRRTMGDKSKMHRKIADNKLMFIGIAVGILFWLLEAAIHASIFYHGRLIDEILATDPHETWMRSLVKNHFHSKHYRRN